jgi:hypothetical protein
MVAALRVQLHSGLCPAPWLQLVRPEVFSNWSRRFIQGGAFDLWWLCRGRFPFWHPPAAEQNVLALQEPDPLSNH